MAKITLNTVFDEMYGRFGGFIFRRSLKGRLFLSRVPNMKRVRWSKAQKLHRQRFGRASAYAKAAMKDPELLAYYQELARQRNSRAYNMAVSEFFTVQKLLKE
jgi:hypothetical protein